MAFLDRIIRIESAEWFRDGAGDPVEGSESISASWNVWANRRDLGQTLLVGRTGGGVNTFTVREIEYTIRFIPDLSNYLSSLGGSTTAVRLTDGDLRMLVTGTEEVGRERFLIVNSRTPRGLEAGITSPWDRDGARS